MANDCLVTKLKSTVNNDTLEVLGKIKMDVVETTGASFGRFDVISKGEAITFKTMSGELALGFSQNDVTNNPVDELTINPNTNKLVYYKNATYSILIDKYKGIKQIQNTGNENTTLSIDSFKYEDLDTISFVCYGNAKVSGELSSISNVPKVTLHSTDVVGELNNITTINVTNISLYDSNNITGEIRDFANLQVQKGRISGTLTIRCNNKITLNGTIVGNDVVKTIKFGTDMVDPTPEETAQGWQIS